jgi:hypothetical protein
VGPGPRPAVVDAPVVALENAGGERVETTAGPWSVGVALEVPPGERTTTWFRFGLLGEPVDPEVVHETSLAGLKNRLPAAPDEGGRHAALLTGGACADGVLGGHTLNQGSAYSCRHGFNGAQGIRCNTPCRSLPYALDGHVRILNADCSLAPDGDRPGETWALPEFGTAMQAYPVANLHSHSQPLLAYLRLRGVVPRLGERA